MSLASLDLVPTYPVRGEQNVTTVPWAMTQWLAEPEPLDSAHTPPSIPLSKGRPLLDPIWKSSAHSSHLPASAPTPTSPAAHQANQALGASAWLYEGPSIGPWTLVPSCRHRPHRPRLSCARQRRLTTFYAWEQLGTPLGVSTTARS